MSAETPTDHSAAWSEDDLALTRAALEGVPGARALLAERLRCAPKILKIINVRRGGLLSAHDLEDLSQDTVIKILQKLEAFPGHATLEAWAYRFCYLEYMNRIRSHQRRSTVAISGLEADLESDEPVHASLDPGQLEEWLARMSPAEAEVMRMRLFDGLEFKEIAARSATPLATIRSRYYRGLVWLKDRIGSLLEDRA